MMRSVSPVIVAYRADRNQAARRTPSEHVVRLSQLSASQRANCLVVLDGEAAHAGSCDGEQSHEAGEEHTCTLTADGEPCTANTDCCSGLCGADGRCGETPTGCVAAAGTCITSADCCSGACVDDGTGMFTCGVGYGACEPLTEACTTATDC